MSERKLASFLLKLLGIFCIIRSIEHLSLPFMIVANFGRLLTSNPSLFTSNPSLFILGFLPFLILVIAAYILIAHAEALTDRLFPSDQAIGHLPDEPGDGWYKLAFTVTGVVLLVSNIPAGVTQLVINFSLTQMEGLPDIKVRSQRGGWIILIRTMLNLAAGLYLVLGSDHLVGILRKFRKE